eukprot:TRINITY_DN1325_c0_g1_i1.p1 TRINITY_DN1325_c0_g1~~TRINITY_DN1325_c0_g1_i1.p1  ORF type:complete len:766 (+),score=127.42 TRINITY_DN1325_c0_g1_i1:256-2553(+)
MHGCPRGCCARAVDALVRPLLCDADTEQSIRAKRLIVPVLVALAPLYVLSIVVDPTSSMLHAVGGFAGILTTIIVYLGWYFYPAKRVDVFALLSCIVLVLLADSYSLSKGDRRWSYAVLVMDMALVANASNTCTGAMLGILSSYLLLVGVDRATAMLYREVGSSDPWLCDCSDPPCRQPLGHSLRDTFGSLFVFLCDFYLTREFASAMRKQVEAMQAATEVTENIAELLSRYEVEEGSALLQNTEERLQPGLKSALHRLLQNLQAYKPYLPDSMVLLPHLEPKERDDVEPPGFGQELPVITMCFTDIQASTELWELCPQGMHTALQQHNEVMRSCASSVGGYEVKVIGDSFMLAFTSAENGCRFALRAQLALMEVKWPSDLLQHPLCQAELSKDGGTLWSGPRVRIGLNCGPVRVEKNPVTGRCDYFGTPVNTAARVEACLGHGGLTGVTEAVLSEMGPGWGARLGNPVCKALGRKELKGVTAAVDVTVLLNASLSDRLALLSTPVPRFGQVRLSSVLEASGWSSGAGSTRYFAVEGAVPTPFRDGLSQRTATCASFRPRCTDHLPALGTAVSDMLEAVGQAADATQGVIAGSMSMQCVVVWNGPRACGDHYDQCLRASDYVRRLRGGAVAAGCCTGEVLYGSVSALRKKHATVIGGCVELSSALAEAADEGGEAALATGTFALYCGTQRRTACYAEWRVSQSCEEITVFSILPAPSDEEMWLESPRMRQESEQRFHSPDSFCAAESASERRCRVVLVGAGVQMA